MRRDHLSFLRFVVDNQLHFAFIQYTLIFLVIYRWGMMREKRKFVLGAASCVLVLTGACVLINIYATGLVWFSSILLTIACTKKINLSLLLPSFAILLYILMNYLAGDLASFFIADDLVNDNLLVAVSSILYLSSAGGIWWLVKNISKKINVSEKLIWSASFLSMLTFVSYFVIIVIERFVGEESVMGKANSFFIIGYGLVSMAVFLILLYSFQKDYAVKEKQRELQHLKIYTDQLENNYNEMRRFRHDYQNILLSMENFIQEENLEGLKNYFYTKVKETSKDMTSNNYKLSQISNIKNSEMKSLFANKLTIAQELGTDTEIEVNEPIEFFSTDSIFLVRSLGIILDNAIEAAELQENGLIRAALFKDTDKIKIIVANSCSKDLPKLFELKKEGFSTKGEQRGMGLSNLERMTASVKNVVLETKIESDMFFQILTLGE